MQRVILWSMIVLVAGISTAHASGTFSSCGPGLPDPTPVPKVVKQDSKPHEPIATGPEGRLRQCQPYEIVHGIEVPLGQDWRKDNFLWKPQGEHSKKLVIVTLPRGAVDKVYVASVTRPNGTSRRILFYSTGDAGDSFHDLYLSGRQIGNKYASVAVALVGKTTRVIIIPCPGRRSDGAAE